MEDKIYQTTKLWKSTLKKIKDIAHLNGISMVRAVDMMADKELERIKNSYNASDSTSEIVLDRYA